MLARTLVLLALALMTSPMGAQEATSWDSSRLYLTRERLQELEEEYREALASTAYSDALREQARATLARIEERLARGDFRIGDRIVIDVQGEAALSETTLIVEPGPAVTLPIIGSISLSGVLRSELDEHLTREIGRFISDPLVRASPLIRLSIQGAVASPGFYVLPANLLMGDVIMAAGGPAQTADLDGMRIERGESVFISADVMRRALVEGRSLDQLNLQAGDEVHVPFKATTSWTSLLVRYSIIIASSLLLGIQIF